MIIKYLSHVFVVCLLFMIISSVHSKNLSSLVRIPVTKYELKNGLRVILNPEKQGKICSYLLGFSTGSRHEKKGITGISHMFEHLMFKGTERYPHFSKTFSENGIIGTNAFTSYDYTAYKAEFPCDQLNMILDMESDRLTNLSLSQEDLDKERQAVQEERRLSIDNSPMGELFELFFSTMFTKHSYRWPIIGYEKDIADYNLKNLRNWYKTYYSPNNATLVLSGDFSESQAKKSIEKYFGALQSKDIPKEIPISEPKQSKARYKSLKRDVQSAQVFMGFKIGQNGTKDSLALRTLAALLGSGESSRLYKKLVRERKLIPSISVDTVDLFQQDVFMLAYPLPKQSKEKEIQRIIKQEINKILTEPISERELGKIKNTQLSDLIERLKTSQSRAYTLLKYEIYFKDYKKIYQEIDDLDNLSVQDIQSIGKKYLTPEKMSYVILKPKK